MKSFTVQKLELNNFLNGIYIPMLPEGLRADLEKEITLEEISTAIDSIKMGKTPGLVYSLKFIKSLKTDCRHRF